MQEIFEVDQQTIKELHIMPLSKGERSVMDIFDRVQTYGGRRMLELAFSNPMCDAVRINNRVECLRFLENGGPAMEIDAQILDFIEHYYSLTKIPSRYSSVDAIRRWAWARVNTSNEYYIIQRAVKWLVAVIRSLHKFASSPEWDRYPTLLKEMSLSIRAIVETEEMLPILGHPGQRFTPFEIEKFDHILRYKRRNQVRELLSILYTIDMFQAVIATKAERGFTFARIRQKRGIVARGVCHPFINGAVANDIEMEQQNMAFITGANMSGKSTFMKALGVAVYLAHMGFPVPAESLEMAPLDGMLTTISVTDDITLGYSHFYSEVKRIKFVAGKVADPAKSYLVMFDELFRGTNVKDAHEATVEIIGMFAALTNSIFIFSSHILEAAEQLADQVSNMQFLAFRSEMDNNRLIYSYRIEPGISNDRFGMHVIKNEGIQQIIAHYSKIQ